MSVAVYKLRIREDVGDDSRWQEARVVAASLAEALAQAQQRYGEARVMAIALDAVGEPPTAADLAAAGAADATVVREPVVVVPEPRVVPAPTRADAFVAAVTDADETPRAPMPWEGRWRPANLLKIGVAAGLVAFVGWYQFGGPASERFVTAAPVATDKPEGLALGDAAPRGGVLAATGVPLRRGDDPVALGEMVGEAVAEAVIEDGVVDPPAPEDDVTRDPAVRAIGTLVGEMFSRWPNHEPVRPDRRDDRPYRDARTGEIVGEPQPALPPVYAPREPSVLRPFYVGVDRGGGVMETLRVPAYDADHARAIVSDLPERPVIVRGPSTQLDW